MPYLRTLSLIIATLCISACTAFASFSRIQPGQTVEAEVLARHGEPVRVWREPDGGKTLEYSMQPFGSTCHMVRIGRDGLVMSVENTLSNEGLGRVTTGMSREQINHLLGTPRSTATYSLSGEEVWDWTVPDQSVTGVKRFNVHFIAGKVVRTSSNSVDTYRD